MYNILTVLIVLLACLYIIKTIRKKWNKKDVSCGCASCQMNTKCDDATKENPTC